MLKYIWDSFLLRNDPNTIYIYIYIYILIYNNVKYLNLTQLFCIYIIQNRINIEFNLEKEKKVETQVSL